MWIELPKHVLKPADWNYKTSNARKMKKLERNMVRNGLIQNLIVRPIAGGFYEVVNGNHRLEVMQTMRIDKVMCFNLGNVTVAQAKRIALETNETSFDRDDGKLAGILKDLHVEFDTKELFSTLSADLVNLDKIINKTVTEIEDIDLELGEPVYSTDKRSRESKVPIDYQSTRIDKGGVERNRRIASVGNSQEGESIVPDEHSIEQPAAMKYKSSSMAQNVKQLEDDMSHSEGNLEWYDPKSAPKDEMRTIKIIVPKSVKELFDLQMERIAICANDKNMPLSGTQVLEVFCSIVNDMADEQISNCIS